jgi:hypothetical protein
MFPQVARASAWLVLLIATAEASAANLTTSAQPRDLASLTRKVQSLRQLVHGSRAKIAALTVGPPNSRTGEHEDFRLRELRYRLRTLLPDEFPQLRHLEKQESKLRAKVRANFVEIGSTQETGLDRHLALNLEEQAKTLEAAQQRIRELMKGYEPLGGWYLSDSVSPSFP